MPYSDVPSRDTQAAKVDFIKPYLPMVASASAIRERHFWILLDTFGMAQNHIPDIQKNGWFDYADYHTQN